MIYKTIKNKIMNKEQFGAMSLPFDLMFKDTFRNSIHRSTGILNSGKFIDSLKGGVYSNGLYMSWENFTPILHPLSDLTKNVWIEKLNTFACELLDATHVYDEKNIVGLNWMTHPFAIVMWLIENHFDVAGLIEKGEAIDVNTLPENPYK
jgi:hypothetical protein